MVERNRERALTVRLLDTERDMLTELTERERVTASEWIRNMIRREHALAFAAQPTKKKRKN